MSRVVGAVLGCLLVVFAAGMSPADPGYLGIATAPLDPALTEHLELGEGVGLTVTHVDEEGPTAEALKINDVLHAVGGQILVNHEQLVTLVQHVYKAGDEVELKFYRRGREESAAVTLGELPEGLAHRPPRPRLRLGPPPQHGQPQHHQWQWPPRNRTPPKGQQPWQHHWKSFPDDLEDLQEHIQEWVEQMQERHGKFRHHPWHDLEEDEEDEGEHDEEDDDDADVHVRTFSSTEVKTRIVTSDGDLTMTLESDGESKHLKAERDGQVIFDGDINTEAERENIPADVLEKLQKMEQGININIQTSGGDKGKSKAKGKGRKRITIRRDDEISI